MIGLGILESFVLVLNEAVAFFAVLGLETGAKVRLGVHAIARAIAVAALNNSVTLVHILIQDRFERSTLGGRGED